MPKAFELRFQQLVSTVASYAPEWIAGTQIVQIRMGAQKLKEMLEIRAPDKTGCRENNFCTFPFFFGIKWN